MMNYILYYPGWKTKALTFSYDDGRIYDRDLVRMFDRYGLHGTFHLNSGKFGQEEYIEASEVRELYRNHEVACHGVEHRFPAQLSKEQLLWEYLEDRSALEKLTGKMVRGCSYAYGQYNDQVVRTLETLGILYSRTVEGTGDFKTPGDFLRWHPTCHHRDAFGDLADRFLDMTGPGKLPLLYIWGHSYEFPRQNNWGQMEELCAKLSGREEVWYTTNIEYVDYMTAVQRLQFSVDKSIVCNPSKIPVYIEINGERRIV